MSLITQAEQKTISIPYCLITKGFHELMKITDPLTATWLMGISM